MSNRIVVEKSDGCFLDKEKTIRDVRICSLDSKGKLRPGSDLVTDVKYITEDDDDFINHHRPNDEMIMNTWIIAERVQEFVTELGIDNDVKFMEDKFGGVELFFRKGPRQQTIKNILKQKYEDKYKEQLLL